MTYNMDLTNILAIAILFTIITRSSSTTHCDIDGSSCTYTVICKNYPGSVTNNPTCNNDPNVTFLMMSSTAKVVTTGFFGSTNFDSRVRTIQAVNSSWTTLGTLAFRYYSKVRRIDLSGNYILDIQEETFKTLLTLNYLNLSNNIIAELHPKSFLVTESKNTGVEILDLSNNRLTSMSDEILSHLPNLMELYLQGNQLKSLSDYCFGSQKYLIILQLQNNFIERLNMSLINLKNLKYLDLSYNYLKKISGYETNRLQALEKINISNNVLQTIESNCFVQSSNLKVVDLSFNLINSTIDNILFAANMKLEYLDLYTNCITSIEGNSFKHNKLTYFNLISNKLSGEIKDNTFVGLNNITKLDLSLQNISAINNYAFSVMNMLLQLNLSRNHINTIGDYAFNNSSVNIIDFTYNNISKLNFLNNSLYNLTELYLNNNNITVLYKNTFKDQTIMKKLDLSGNKMISIESNSLPLQKLQYLFLQNNRFTGDLKSEMLSPAKFLRFLDLSYYNISYIGNSTFVEMPVLAKLNISHNSIKKIESDNFRNLHNLYSLDVSFNNLTDLQFNNSLLTDLKAVYLNNNKLTNISRIFPSTCKLQYLDMSYNGLSDVSNVDSKLFPELENLHLSHNNIKNFNNPGTNTLENLSVLELSSNNMKDINLSYYKKLMMVDLSNNLLRIINNTFFKNIAFVQSIDLSRNDISDLPPGTFQDMRNLRLLNLSSNYISKLRYGSLKGLHRTNLLDLSNNKIDSLDVNVFHECTELKTLIIDYNRIKTLDIERLVLVTQRKLKTLSLGGNPISCQEIIRNTTLNDLSFYGINQIEVTSIHKIYDEDNVRGIKCGDDELLLTTTIKVEKAIEYEGEKTSSLFWIAIWCSILTIIAVVAIGVTALIKWRKKTGEHVIYRQSRVHLRSSLDGSEYDNIMN